MKFWYEVMLVVGRGIALVVLATWAFMVLSSPLFWEWVFAPSCLSGMSCLLLVVSIYVVAHYIASWEVRDG